MFAILSIINKEMAERKFSINEEEWLLYHSLLSFLETIMHPIPPVKKIAAKRNPIAQPIEAIEVNMNKNNKNHPQINKMLERKSFIVGHSLGYTS